MLNLDHDEARALHRIVRAMHDGECPKCHRVFSSDQMRHCDKDRSTFTDPRMQPIIWTGWRCPACGFRVSDDEATAVFQIFAPFMERNLAIFEAWRASRSPPTPAQEQRDG